MLYCCSKLALGCVLWHCLHGLRVTCIQDMHVAQVIQRDRLVACMLEHIEEEHAGRVHVRHNMQVQGLAMREGDKVSLQWSQESQSAEGTTEPHGTTETDFVVSSPPRQTIAPSCGETSEPSPP